MAVQVVLAWVQMFSVVSVVLEDQAATLRLHFLYMLRHDWGDYALSLQSYQRPVDGNRWKGLRK